MFVLGRYAWDRDLGFVKVLVECMKIWCCLCFTREEEEEEDVDDDEEGKELGEEGNSEAMREGVFGNESNPEGRIGNDDDPEADVERLLGLAALSPQHLDCDDDDDDEQLRLFEDAVVAMRGGGGVVGGGAHWDGAARAADPLPFLGVRTARRFEGESSSASAETAAVDHDRDSHNKRAKVHYDLQ